MPLLSNHLSPSIGIWEITESWQDMLELLENKSMYADKMHEIQSDNRKQEWLSVRLLVKNLTNSYTTIDYLPNGTPFLSDNHYHISISHTKGYSAIILSQYTHPGIDIEYRSERAWKLRTKFLNEKELAYFAPSDNLYLAGCEKHTPQATQDINSQASSKTSQPSTLATLCWCAKETAYKVLQETSVDFIKHLHIKPLILSKKGIILLEETKTNQQKTVQIHYQITDEYIITWKE